MNNMILTNMESLRERSEYNLYLDQGKYYFNTMNFKEALYCFKKSLNLIQISAKFDNSNEIVYIYHWIIMSLFQSAEYEKSIEEIDRCIFRFPQKIDTVTLCQMYIHKGMSLACLDRLSESISSFEQAVDISNSWNDNDVLNFDFLRVKADLFQNYASALVRSNDEKNLSRAERIYDDAAAIYLMMQHFYHDWQGKYRSSVTLRLPLLKELGRYEEYEAHAFRLINEGIHDTDIAVFLYDKYQRNGDLEYLKKSFDQMNKSYTINSYPQIKFENTGYKTDYKLFENEQYLYRFSDIAYDIFLQSYNVKYLLVFLSRIDLNFARLLSASIKKNIYIPDFPDKIPSGEKNLIKASLRKDYDHMQIIINFKNIFNFDNPKYDILYRVAYPLFYINAKMRHRSLIKKIRKKYDPGFLPKFFNYIKPEEIKKLASIDNTTVMLLLPSDNYTYQYIMDKGEITVNRLDITRAQVYTIEATIQKIVVSALKGSDLSNNQRGRKKKADDPYLKLEEYLDECLPLLYQKIISPVKDQLSERIVFIPVGHFTGIPLHLLKDNTSSDKQYLFQKYYTTFAPSLSILKAQVEHEKKKIAPQVDILIAPAQGVSESDISGLKASLSSVSCSVTKVNSDNYLSAFNDSLSPVIQYFGHSSPHGIVVPVNHETRNKEDSIIIEIDDLLTDIKVKSSLTILSSCISGSVIRDDKKNEYIGVETAFLQSGSNTISSYWHVDRYDSAELFSRFYNKLFDKKNHVPVYKALIDAQREMVEEYEKTCQDKKNKTKEVRLMPVGFESSEKVVRFSSPVFIKAFKFMGW